MPNPPKPTELKRKLGNPGKRALPAAVVALEPAVMPVGIEPPQTRDELVAALWAYAGAWIAKSDALFLMPMLLDAWERRQQLKADVEANGIAYESTGPLGNRLFRRPEAIELEKLEERITKWLSLLALDPTSRSRLGVAEVKARTKLEELQERRARASQAGRRPS